MYRFNAAIDADVTASRADGRGGLGMGRACFVPARIVARAELVYCDRFDARGDGMRVRVAQVDQFPER
jgi:hypothetical protein